MSHSYWLSACSSEWNVKEIHPSWVTGASRVLGPRQSSEMGSSATRKPAGRILAQSKPEVSKEQRSMENIRFLFLFLTTRQLLGMLERFPLFRRKPQMEEPLYCYHCRGELKCKNDPKLKVCEPPYRSCQTMYADSAKSKFFFVSWEQPARNAKLCWFASTVPSNSIRSKLFIGWSRITINYTNIDILLAPPSFFFFRCSKSF